MLRDITPHAAAYAARCKADDLRNWRKLGLIDQFGERDGKAHLYSADEVIAIAVAHFLAKRGLGLRGAFHIVRERGYLFEALARGSSLNSQHPAFLSITFDDDLSNGYRSVTSAPINRIMFDDMPIAMQINLTKVAQEALARIDYCPPSAA